MVEIMACPGGCVQGAGHPVPDRVGELAARERVLANIDGVSEFRGSQDNPDVLRLYDDFYGEPNSPVAHDLLHTTYAPFRREPAPTT
jgi:formate dehydrogenase major subunit